MLRIFSDLPHESVYARNLESKNQLGKRSTNRISSTTIRLVQWFVSLGRNPPLKKLRSKNIITVREQRLRIFTDASSIGFGVVIYQCTYYIDGSVEGSFVVSKTRVAPLKQQTIPEFELKGACEGVDLVKTVVTELNMNMRDVTLHTDSETVLGGR